MIKFINFCLLISRKLIELLTDFAFFTATELTVKRDLLFPTIFVLFFYSTFFKIFSLLKELQFDNLNIGNIKNEIFNYFSSSSSQKSSFDPLILLLFFICFLIFFFIIIGIYKQNKTNEEFVPMGERFFVLLPYLWFLLEMTYSMLDSCAVCLKLVFSKDDASFIIYEIIGPCLAIYLAIPGIKFGLVNNFVYYFNYFYIGRNKIKFSFFTRYFYMQSLAISSLFSLIMHIYYLSIKYGLDPVLRQFLGLNIYALFFTATIIIIIFAIWGKEPTIPGMHSSILYHVGLKGTKKKKR
jgi:hypothetical protein